MNIKSRIKKIETDKDRNFDKWLNGLSDGELEAIIAANRNDTGFSEWLKTLTDGELEIVRYGRPGASAIRERFNEHFKQIEENGKPNNKKGWS